MGKENENENDVVVQPRRSCIVLKVALALTALSSNDKMIEMIGIDVTGRPPYMLLGSYRSRRRSYLPDEAVSHYQSSERASANE